MARFRVLEPDLGGDLGGDGADVFLRVLARVVGMVHSGGGWLMRRDVLLGMVVVMEVV